MTKYTSLDISKRLKAAGFHIKGDSIHWEPGIKFTDSGGNIRRYRADTLLEWLLERGVGVYLDRENGVDYVYPYGADAHSITASSLPDALGEIVLEVLAREREP
jgi:hypothetical protein